MNYHISSHISLVYKFMPYHIYIYIYIYLYIKIIYIYIIYIHVYFKEWYHVYISLVSIHYPIMFGAELSALGEAGEAKVGLGICSCDVGSMVISMVKPIGKKPRKMVKSWENQRKNGDLRLISWWSNGELDWIGKIMVNGTSYGG